MAQLKRYVASFHINDQPLLKVQDDDLDSLIARATRLLESAYKDATCTIEDSTTQTVIQTLKRNSIE